MFMRSTLLVIYAVCLSTQVRLTVTQRCEDAWSVNCAKEDREVSICSSLVDRVVKCPRYCGVCQDDDSPTSIETTTKAPARICMDGDITCSSFKGTTYCETNQLVYKQCPFTCGACSHTSATSGFVTASSSHSITAGVTNSHSTPSSVPYGVTSTEQTPNSVSPIITQTKQSSNSVTHGGTITKLSSKVTASVTGTMQSSKSVGRVTVTNQSSKVTSLGIVTKQTSKAFTTSVTVTEQSSKYDTSGVSVTKQTSNSVTSDMIVTKQSSNSVTNHEVTSPVTGTSEPTTSTETSTVKYLCVDLDHVCGDLHNKKHLCDEFQLVKKQCPKSCDLCFNASVTPRVTTGSDSTPNSVSHGLTSTQQSSSFVTSSIPERTSDVTSSFTVNSESTTPKPTTTIKSPPYLEPLSCRTCEDPFCDMGIEADHNCPVHAPFCMNIVGQDSHNIPTLTKRCADESQCEESLLKGRSLLTECLNLNLKTPPKGPYECTFCCITPECNVPVIPRPETLYSGNPSR